MKSWCQISRSSPFAGFAVLAGIAVGVAPLAAQEAELRAVPSAVTPPPVYRAALERGWRSQDGSPGHAYWQQWASYDLEAELDPESGLLTGSVSIRYANNAPASFSSIWMHLHQNLHKASSPRSGSAEITGGVTLTRVMLGEQQLEEDSGYEVDGTLMQLRLGAPVEQGDTIDLEIDWTVTLPQNGSGRMGHSGHEMYFIAYWFPKIAVFDALRGWDAEPFLGGAEFYDAFADYTAALTVPEGWTVMATGELQNPDDVLSAITVDRLQEASISDELVVIAGQAERDAGTVTASSATGSLTYRFGAENVRDFAWTTSNVQQWSATSAVVPDRDEDGEEDRVLIHSFWRPERAPLWSEQWEYAKQSIEHHSRYTGFAYPWPHMTSVEGADIIDGGMEFPMMTLIGPYQGQAGPALFNVTSHEIGHMWVPMIVGTNEKRHAWMDEGSTTFLEDVSRMEIWPGVDHHRIEGSRYLQVAAAELEQSMMRHGDFYEPGPGYSIASYSKPATLMVALREIMGREAWEEAYRAFISEWAFRHPTPWDFFATFERFAEDDLDWFWTAFYYETWALDHAVGAVTSNPDGSSTIVIEDRGLAPFPATVRIRTSQGTVIQRDVPVRNWLLGRTEYTISIDAGSGRVTRVEIDPAGYAPDVDRSNNLWPRG